MGLFNSIRLGSSAAGDYEIERSLRFNDSDFGTLARSPSSASNRKTMTLSLWVKGMIGGTYTIFDSHVNDSNRTRLFFNDNGSISFFNRVSNSDTNCHTTGFFRDPSAWYHIVFAFDMTQASASNRYKIYINGVEQANDSNIPAQNVDLFFNNTTVHRFGVAGDDDGNENPFDGYMAEVNFIDGSALTPSSFGETDATTGQWNPKEFNSSVIPNKSSRTFSSSGWTLSASGWSGSNPITNAYNGSIGTSTSDVANNNAGGVTATWDTSSYNLTGNLRIFCWSDGGEYDIYVNGNATKVADTPSGSGNAAWVDCGTHTNINEIQFAGTSYDSNTGLGSSGFYIAGFMVNGTLLEDTTPEFGTNGFYLNFSDNSGTTATTLGKDSSGNGNNWTPYNFSVSAGTGNDSLEDTPTNNFATLNVLKKPTNSTFSNGNLDGSGTASSWVSFFSTILVSSGKWFCEVKVNATRVGVGIGKDGANENSYLGGAADTYAYYDLSGKWNNGSDSSYGATYGANDIIGMALDMDAGTLIFYKNGVSQGTAFTGLSGEFALGFSVYGSGASASINYGQRAFDYTVPTGYKALNSANLPDPSIALPDEHFAPLLYTGNATDDRSLTVGFQPDLTILKQRDDTKNWYWYDSVRGVNKQLLSNANNAEAEIADRLQAFESNGIQIGASSEINNNSSTYVNYSWKGGGTASSNSDGTLTSSVSANTTAGFSIVGYTGNGSNGQTVGHGLGVAPDVIILKARGAAQNWRVWHRSLATDGSKRLLLDATNASEDAAFLNDTAPTSTLFTLGNSDDAWNANGSTFIAYLFSEVAGYSKFGSYTGNGSSDGTFIFTGFKVAFLITKKVQAENWHILDTTRDPNNPNTFGLDPNLANAEADDSNLSIDFLSNGFKLRTSHSTNNQDGVQYIYLAFAESPFKYSRAR